MSHVAFARHPSHHRGILYSDTLQPLVLHGCAVDVELHNFTARVQIVYEYKHLSSRSSKIFVALPNVPHWRLSSLKTESNGRKVDSLVGHGDLRSDASFHIQPIPNAEGFVPSVITQAIPWSLSIQDIVTTTAVFIVPATLGETADTLTITIPKEFFPSRVDPSATEMEYVMQFPTRNLARLPRAYAVNFRGTLLEAAASVPVITNGTQRSNGAVHATNKNSVTARFDFDPSTTEITHAVVIQANMLVSPTEPLQLRMVKEFTVDESSNANGGSENTYAGCASVVPLFNADQIASGPNVELVFMVDASSSMHSHWAALIKAIRVAIHALPSTTYVNIVRYTADLDWAFPQGAELLTEAVRAKLLDEWIPSVMAAPAADGCEAKLYRAVQALYSQPYITGYARCVILATDSGCASNLAHRAVEVVRANTHSTRFSSLALGAHADIGFLKLLAREGNGRFAHATSLQAEDEKLSAHEKLSKSTSSRLAALVKDVHVPTLVHVTATVRYDDRGDEVPPIRLATMRPVLPCIPQHQRYIFHLLGHSNTAPSFTVSVHGLVGLHQLSYKAQSPDLRNLQQASAREVGKTETVSLAHTAAALDRIERVLSGSGERSTPTPEDMREVERLSTTFLLPSPFIPYISTILSQAGSPTTAADESPLAASAVLTARYIAPAHVLRYELESSNRGQIQRDAGGIMAVDPDKVTRFTVAEAAKHRLDGPIDEYLHATVIAEIVRLATSAGDVEDVLLAQTLEGSFDASAALYSGIGVTSGFATERAPAGADALQWATALAVAYLEQSGPRPLISMAVEKGKAYLSKVGADASLVSSAGRVLVQ